MGSDLQSAEKGSLVIAMGRGREVMWLSWGVGLYYGFSAVVGVALSLVVLSEFSVLVRLVVYS